MKVHYKLLKDENVADFLVVTATDVETSNVLNILKPISPQGVIEVVYDGMSYTIGRMGQFNVIHCQCKEMGTQGVGSSTLTVSNALQHWSCIKGVVMVGISFGMYNDVVDENQQHIGDVLVASQIIPYEPQRVGVEEVKYRGKVLHTSDNCLDAFKIIKSDWKEKNLYNEETKVEICPMLSGEKLVDELKFRNKLKAKFVEARGGEMEGNGVAAASVNASLPWMILKAICDFGDGNKKLDKEPRQACAAYLAAKCCEMAFNKVDVLGSLCKGKKSEYIFQPEADISRKVLFFRYQNEYEEFYLSRSIDDEIEEALKVKGCWLSGKTGIGKSVALTRVLLKNGKNLLFVDLSCCGENPLDDLFKTIYELLCEKLNLTPQSKIYTFNEYAHEISRLISQYFPNQEFYFFIEEIPISGDEIDKFKTFVRMFCAFVIQNTFADNNTDVRFILSSIHSPRPFLNDYQEKVSSYVKFIEMKDWPKEELITLTSKINEVLGFNWGDIRVEDFVDICDTPRKVKDALRALFKMGKMKIYRSDLLNI
jgi:nucleoside phosphorylase